MLVPKDMKFRKTQISMKGKTLNTLCDGKNVLDTIILALVECTERDNSPNAGQHYSQHEYRKFKYKNVNAMANF